LRLTAGPHHGRGYESQERNPTHSVSIGLRHAV
jgi:hypothetical protein